MMKIDRCAVIGAGSWGTALALLLAGKGLEVRIWSGESDHIKELQRDRENRRFVPGHPFPASLSASDDLPWALDKADCVVMAIPSHGFRAVYQQVYPLLPEGIAVVSVAKGIELESGMTMTDIMKEEGAKNGENKKIHLGALSGPSFAKEVAEDKPTAVTVAFADLSVAEAVQHLFSTDVFRAYSSTDIIGLEICGAVKNIIAIAAGICDGLGYGLNTRAALITRGLVEISRLGVRMGAQVSTFAGLAGMGDLLLTCTGDLSRNRSVGLKLGSGLTLDQALAEMTMVAEGVRTTLSCHKLAHKLGVEMPILDQVYQVLYCNKSCAEAVSELFQRDLKREE